VTAVDARARERGIRVGTVATKARILVPDLLFRDADPSADAAGLERLAAWAYRRYAPLVAVDPPDGLVIDSTGSSHLFGGEEAMATDIVSRLERIGVTARVAVADTAGAARALALCRARPTMVVPPGSGSAPLADLPLAALRVSAETVRSLRVLGIIRVGDVLRRPRAPLALRFGADFVRRLDRALGYLPEAFEPVRPSEAVETRLVFAEPLLSAESLSHQIDTLTQRLRDSLELRGVGARRLDLVCRRVDARDAAIRVGTARPVRDPLRLARLLRERIETIDPGFGIEVMTLIAAIVEPLEGRQTVLSSIAGEVEEPDLSDLIDILRVRVGEERVHRLGPTVSEVPERSVGRRSALAPATGASWPADRPRPARLFAPPEPIETLAMLPDHPPATFTWRGARRRVRRADGPERIFGEWWKRGTEEESSRDYFRVEDEEGERWWIFRAGTGEGEGPHRWFLHGVFG